MIFYILFILFFFFTHKQTYAGRHFTGASEQIGCFITLFGLAGFVFELYVLINIAIRESVIEAIMLFVLSIVAVFILNSITSKFAMKKTLSEMDFSSDMMFGYYNYRCDVIATILALIGVVYNIFFVVYYFVS